MSPRKLRELSSIALVTNAQFNNVKYISQKKLQNLCKQKEERGHPNYRV